jgi:hypothetical protein
MISRTDSIEYFSTVIEVFYREKYHGKKSGKMDFSLFPAILIRIQLLDTFSLTSKGRDTTGRITNLCGW